MKSKSAISSGDIWGIGNVIGSDASSKVELNLDISINRLIFGEDGYTLELNPLSTIEPTNSFFNHPNAQHPELNHNIGHFEKLADLTDLFTQAKNENQGSIVFLTGEYGYGRKALGRAFIDSVRAADETGVIGRFWPKGHHDEIWQDPRWRPALEKYRNDLQQEDGFLSEEPFFPLKPILAQLLDLTSEETPRGKLKIPDSPENFRYFLREFVGPRRPLVLLLEDFEHADPEWMELIEYLEPEINDGLPILLLITLHTDRQIDLLDEEQRTAFQQSALELAENDRAEIYFLSNVTKDDIAAYTGPAESAVVDRLHQLSAGKPLYVELLWQEWRHWDVVEKDSDGNWHWNRPIPTWVFGNTRDFIEDAINELWPLDDSPPWHREQMVEILTCASELGLKFSAEVLANAFEVKPDVMASQLDCFLESRHSPDSFSLLAKEDSYRIELEFIDDHKELKRYRFQPELVWFIFNRFYQRDLSEERYEKLAQGLEKAYWPQIETVSLTLWSLYKKAGNAEKADQYRRLSQPASRFDDILLQIEITKTFLSSNSKYVTARSAFGDKALSSNIGEDCFALKKGCKVRDGIHNENYFLLPDDVAKSRLLNFYRKLGFKWYAYYKPQHAKTLFTEMYELAEDIDNKQHKAYALLFLGSVAQFLGQFEIAEMHYQDSLKINTQLYSEYGIAINLYMLGELAKARGQYKRARTCFLRGLEIYKKLKEESWIAHSLNSLGSIAHICGYHKQAKEKHEQALDIYTRLNIDTGVAKTFSYLGTASRMLGQYKEAQSYYKQALDFYEGLGDKAVIATLLVELMYVYIECGIYEEADKIGQRALFIFEKTGNNGIEACLTYLARLALRQEWYKQAELRYSRLLEIDSKTEDEQGIAISLHGLGNVAWKYGEYEQAKFCYLQSLEIHKKLGCEGWVAATIKSLGDLAYSRRYYEQAKEYYQQALKIRTRLGENAGIADNLSGLGKVANKRCEYEQAEMYCQRSLKVNKRLGRNPNIAVNVSNLGDIARERGQYVQAEEHYRRSLEIERKLGRKKRVESIESKIQALKQEMAQAGDNDE